MQTEYDNPNDPRFEDLLSLLDNLGINYTLGSTNEEGKNIMENVDNQTPVATPEQQTLTPEQMAKLMEDMANQPITSDEAEPTDAERAIH